MLNNLTNFLNLSDNLNQIGMNRPYDAKKIRFIHRHHLQCLQRILRNDNTAEKLLRASRMPSSTTTFAV